MEITSGDDFIFEEIQRRGYQLGKNQEKRSNCKTRTVLGKTKELRKLNLLNNKHIPGFIFKGINIPKIRFVKGLNGYRR